MTSSFATREIHYGDETSFAENANSPSTNTFSHRMTVLSIDSGPPDQDRQTDGSLMSRQNDSRPGFLGAKGGGTFEFTTYWPGYGATTASGALAETWFQDLLGDGLGGSDVTEVGGAITACSDATYFTYSASGSPLAIAHGAIRVGTKGDGRNDGQFLIPASVDGSRNVTLLTAAGAAVSTADTMYAAQIAYPIETLGNSKRFYFGWTTTGAQYQFMGCHLDGLTFNFPFGALPTVKWRYRYAYWARDARPVPSTSSMDTLDVAPVAGGSVFFQTLGTATRATISPSEITLSLDMGLAEQAGPSTGTYQYISGYSRLRCVPTLSLLVPWSTTYEGAAYTTDGNSTTDKHILVSLSCGDGTAVGFYMPNAYPVGPLPTYEEYNGLLYQRLTFRGREHTTVTNDRTRACIRFFSA